MPRSVLRFTLAIGLLTVTLASSAAAAGRPAAAPSRGEAFWTFLAQLVPIGLGKIGCSFDPHGRCIEKPINKNGCSYDPNGRCTPKEVPVNKAGCSYDPDGRCISNW